MTVGELKVVLEDAMDDDAKVTIVSQPTRHPLQYRIERVEVVDDEVLIIEGGQMGYIPINLQQDLNLR